MSVPHIWTRVKQSTAIVQLSGQHVASWGFGGHCWRAWCVGCSCGAKSTLCTGGVQNLTSWALNGAREIVDPLKSSGHYMYRTMVTICTEQWSLYEPHSDHCMYRTVVTIRTVNWSLYVPPSGHYMYRTVVTICTAQWSLYVPPI